MGGLFGSAAQSTTQGGGGLFGGALGAQSQQQQQQSQGTGALGGSMFGSQFGGAQPSAAGPSQNVLGQPALGAGFKLGQANGQQTVVPGVRIDVSNIRGTTRYNDLQEDLQKQIAEYDAGLQKFIKDKEAVDSFMPKHGELLAQIPHDVNFVTRKSDGAQHALASDVAAVNALRDLVKADAESAKLSFKAVDNLKLPSQYHQAGLWSTARPQSNGAGANGAAAAADAETSSDLISLFSRTAEEMEQTMRLYSQNLAEIESHLHGVQANLHGQMQRAAAQTKTGAHPGGADEKLAELAAFLREFEEGIFRAATQVGAAREGMTELQLGEFHG